MRAEVMPTHDAHSFYFRWEVIYEGKERERLAALGGPLTLEVDVSSYIDLGGVRHETAKVKVPIWPYAGPKNIGQSRFWDVDSRRRFWVNLQEAIGTTVVDWLFDAAPGSVGKDGAVIRVPEIPGTPVRPSPPPAAKPTPATSAT
jgi:hypothetical protein